MARVLPKFGPHRECHTVNDIEHRIKSTLTKNQYNIFCNNSIFAVFMKKKSFVVQAQFGRCIMSLETKESTANAIVIRAKGTNLHFSPREFAVVTGLNCVSNKDDFVFDEDLPNILIEDYFGGAKYIQKRELFAAFSEKLWGKGNDEDAVKFANLYFIHAFLLSAVDTVVIPRLYFDLIESGLYSDYPWGSIAFEELAKSLNRKLKPKGKFYMLHGMPLAIQIWLYECCSTVPRNVASRVDSQIPRLLNWKTNSPHPRYEFLMERMFNEADVKVSFKNIEPTQKEISCFRIPKKVGPAGTPKRTPPPRAAKKLSGRTPIFMPIQQKEKVASKKKDLNRSASKKSNLIQSPDSSFCSFGDEDDFVSKKVFHKFRNEKKDKDNEVDNPPMGEAVTEEINGNQSASLIEVYNEDKDDAPDKNDMDQHEARDICESPNTKLVDDNICEAHISDSQFSFPDEVLRSINLDFIKSNLAVEDKSMNNKCDAEKIVDTSEVVAEATVNTSAEDESKDNEGAAEKILNPVESNMDNSKLNQQNQSPVHIHVALTEQRKDEQNFLDSQVTIPDELLPSLNVYLNQERSIIVHPSANKSQEMSMHVSRIKRPSRFKEAPFTMNFGSADEGERKIFYQKHPFVSHPVNDIEDTKITNKFLKWLSVDILKFHAKRSNKQEHYKKGKSKISVINFEILAVENKNWFYIMGTPGQSWSDEHIDVCFYYLRKKSKYDSNTLYKYSTVDCNFMNIINSVLAVYRIDDDSLNAGGKEYHLNEYINEFRMHAIVP
ncbi:hypothetical protein FXO38_07105 [Capsicum annuum]|nr:hypothetical protein FXO38_07105 [Capsicum annuum]